MGVLHMAKWKVVITDWEFADLRFEEEVLHHEDIELIPAQCRSEEELIDICRDADALINQEALIEALVEKQIAGAALDVVEVEPIPEESALLSMDNVILTPHVAWYSEEAAKEMRSKAAMGVVDVLLYGEYPKYLVNKQVKEQVKLRPGSSDERYTALVRS
jgi:D-3-phosphoglycerate dehydrogenase